MQQLVIIQNDGAEDFTAKYDGEYQVIPAGESRTFPWDVMIVWMGDPGVINEHGGRQRDELYATLCGYYNARGLTGNRPEDLPALSAWDLDGNQIITVLDDPTNELYAPVLESGSDAAVLQRQIDRLSAQLSDVLNGLEDTPDRADDDDTELGGRSAGTEGQIREQIAAEDAIPADDDEDISAGTTTEEKPAAQVPTAPTHDPAPVLNSVEAPATLDIPTDSPTKPAVGAKKAAAKAPAAISPAVKRGGSRAGGPRSAGTAGNRRRTAKG